MPSLPTIKIVSKKSTSGYVNINEKDFDPEKNTKWTPGAVKQSVKAAPRAHARKKAAAVQPDSPEAVIQPTGTLDTKISE